MKSQAKTFVATALTLCLTALPLAACGGSSDAGGGADSAATTEQTTSDGTTGEAVDTSGYKTLGEVLALEVEEEQAAWDSSYYIYAFTLDGVPYRAVAEMTSELDSQISELDFLAEDHDEKLREIIGPLPLKSFENLSTDMLSQDELDALVGQTGKELIDDGFEFAGYSFYGGEQTQATMEKGLLSYEVVFDGSISGDADYDDSSLIMEMPVTSISFHGLSNAALDLTAVE